MLTIPGPSSADRATGTYASANHSVIYRTSPARPCPRKPSLKLDAMASQNYAFVTGLGDRPAPFEKLIPAPRPLAPGRVSSLFLYWFARTTLRCNQVWKPSTCCNCCTIGPTARSSSICRAGRSRRLGAYYRCRAARSLTCPFRLPPPPRLSDAAAPASPACPLRVSTPRKG